MDVIFEGEKKGKEEEKAEERRRLRERASRSTKRKTGQLLGNADLGSEITAQAVFASSLYFLQSGQYLIAGLLFLVSGFVAIMKNQFQPGPVVRKLRKSDTFLTRDTTAGFAGYVSMAAAAYFAGSGDWLSSFYSAMIAIYLAIVKYRLPESGVTKFLKKSPDEIVESTRTKFMRK